MYISKKKISDYYFLRLCTSILPFYTHTVAKVEINETEFDSGVSASIDFVDNGLELKITGWVRGLVPGYRGFHIHENPFENGDCMTAGSHFNPLNKAHGRQGQGINLPFTYT